MFTLGDLQLVLVFLHGDDVTGVVDWSEGCQGGAHFDLAILTLGYEEHLGVVVASYGIDVASEVIRAWVWSLRSPLAAAADPCTASATAEVTGLRSRREAARVRSVHERRWADLLWQTSRRFVDAVSAHANYLEHVRPATG